MLTRQDRSCSDWLVPAGHAPEPESCIAVAGLLSADSLKNGRGQVRTDHELMSVLLVRGSGQCCGSGSMIRIRMDPHNFCNLDPHRSDKLGPESDPDPHQFDQKCMEYSISLFEHFFKGLSRYLEAKI
jgi:hypothetical protein